MLCKSLSFQTSLIPAQVHSVKRWGLGSERSNHGVRGLCCRSHRQVALCCPQGWDYYLLLCTRCRTAWPWKGAGESFFRTSLDGIGCGKETFIGIEPLGVESTGCAGEVYGHRAAFGEVCQIFRSRIGQAVFCGMPDCHGASWKPGRFSWQGRAYFPCKRGPDRTSDRNAFPARRRHRGP